MAKKKRAEYVFYACEKDFNWKKKKKKDVNREKVM